MSTNLYLTSIFLLTSCPVLLEKSNSQ